MCPSGECYTYRFVCPLVNGLHARPANRLEQAACGFSSRVWLENLSNHKVANVRSILSLVSADIQHGDECVLRVDGDDRERAYGELVRFLREEFASCDAALEAHAPCAAGVGVPPVLRAAGVPVLGGQGVVPGFGRGKVLFVAALALPEGLEAAADPEAELRKVDRAVVEQRSDLTLRLGSARLSRLEGDVLRAHLSIVTDEELIELIHAKIRGKGMSAGQAIYSAFEHFSGLLRQAQSELIRERIDDLRDVCSQLLGKIYGSKASTHIRLTEPTVCVAGSLTPSQFIEMDKSLLSGLVLTQGGGTSHTVILARSFGIPTLTGVRDAERVLTAGQAVIVDATNGLLLRESNALVERFYAAEQHKADVQRQRTAAFRDKPARTRDGRRLEVMANVAMADEVETAMQNGAEGIGLFRTEMLFLGRDSAPGEAEQFTEYKRAAELAGGKPVIIRTFDIGGDKAVDYIQWETEENPYLGYRGARVYQRYENLLRDQLRAILRASAFGTLKIMIPMVTCAEEVKYVRSVLEQVQADLDTAGIPYDGALSLGIMVEVPSVAFFIPQLAKLIDFLSIGTNDLTQYFLAVDRGNGQVSALYQSRHPGLLALIRKIVEDGHRHGLWVGMCGEMAGQVNSLGLLVGAGLDEVSVSPGSVPAIKAACADYDSAACRAMLEEAVGAATIEQVDAITANLCQPASTGAVVDPCLVQLDADCLNKEEVIKRVSDTLYLTGRSQDAAALEHDFWQREAIYSTGLGHGIAVPHCKTPHIRSDSICVFRLAQPVEWTSVDDVPVDVVIAMTIRDGDHAGRVHMKIFSKLARLIMHEDFRQQLRSIGDAAALVDYLRAKLGLAQPGATD